MSLLPFWALNVVVALLSMQGQKALGFYQKYLNLFSEDERNSYRFEITWWWVINNRIFIFWGELSLLDLITHTVRCIWIHIKVKISLIDTLSLSCPFAFYYCKEMQSLNVSHPSPISSYRMSLVGSSLNGQSHRPLSTERYVVADGWG